MTTSQNTLGYRIAVFIEKEGITIAELARRLSVERSTIYRWISGRSKPSYDKLEKLERIMKGGVLMEEQNCTHAGTETIKVGGDETITVCHDCGLEL